MNARASPPPKQEIDHYLYYKNSCVFLLDCIPFFSPRDNDCPDSYVNLFITLIHKIHHLKNWEASTNLTKQGKGNAAAIRWRFPRGSRLNRVWLGIWPELPWEFLGTRPRKPMDKVMSESLQMLGLPHLGHLEMNQVHWTSGRNLARGAVGCPV